MSFKPEVISQTEIIDQMNALKLMKDQLHIQLEQLEHKLKMIEQSLLENDKLKVKTRELLTQSLSFFEEEWKRKSEYYPDIRRASLQRIVDIVNPAKKGAPTAGAK